MNPTTIVRTEEFNETKTRRYIATRQWNPNQPWLTVVMANPTKFQGKSGVENQTTASAIRIANFNGYGGVILVNLDSRMSVQNLKTPDHDARNIKTLKSVFAKGYDVWLAWGNPGAALASRSKALPLLQRNHGIKVLTIGITKNGQPMHPARKSSKTIFRPTSIEQLIQDAPDEKIG